MAEPIPGTDLSMFDDFDIIRTTYKTVSNHDILAHILVPKHMTSQQKPNPPAPIILRLHGGGFVTSSSLFPDWFPPWALALAARHSAVLVNPDYRLIPESSVDDLLEDIEDFWTWTHDQLPAFILEKTEGKVSVDTERIMAMGDSAGGYLSLQLGLDHPDQIRSVVAAYPMVTTRGHEFTGPRDKPPLGAPHVPASLVEEHRAKIKNGQVPAVISADEHLARLPFMLSLVQNGLYPEFLPADKRRLHILDRLDDGARWPRGGVLVLHGKDDTVVPAEGSVLLAEKIREMDPELKFCLEMQPGEHGFDGTAKLDDEWLANGLRDVVGAWLA